MTDTFRFKVKLTTLRLQRVDGEEEDDFRSFALASLRGDGAESLWYHEAAVDADADSSSNLGKTSVSYSTHRPYCLHATDATLSGHERV